MSKDISYVPPALPEDLLPDLHDQIREMEAKYNQARLEGYVFYQKARAQQGAAEDCKQRGELKDYKVLMEGAQNLVGVVGLDSLAQVRWSEAKAYSITLGQLYTQQAAQEPEESE